MLNSTSYQELSNSYGFQIRTIFLSPEDVSVSAEMRSGAAVPLEILVERAEVLASTSQQLGEATSSYLSDATISAAQQEAAEMKLLAQAIAELETAQALLDSAEAAQRDAAKAPTTSTAEPSRGAKVKAAVQSSVEKSAVIIENPLESGVTQLLSDGHARSGLPDDLAEAKSTLKSTAESGMRSICKDTGKVGWRAIHDLLLMDSAAIRQGVEFVSKDAVKLIDQIMEGVGSFIARLVTTAIRLLGQAYQWIRALLGQEIEEDARKKVGGWLDDLKNDASEEGLFGSLVPQIYKTAAIQTELQGLLESTQVDVARVNQATEAIDSLVNRHQAKAKQIEQLLIVMAFFKRIPVLKVPQAQVMLAAVTLGIASYVLYLGNDHIRDGKVVLNEQFSFSIPDRVVGIREMIQQSLAVAEPPASSTPTA
jgi:hypothetical protein